MKRPSMRSRLSLAALLLAAPAGALPLSIGGEVQSAALESRTLAGGEALALWTLPRLGVAVRNDPQDVRLLYGGRELRWSLSQGWRSVGFSTAERLAAPTQVGPSLYVPLRALEVLGLPVTVTAAGLSVPAPSSIPAGTLPPSPEAAGLNTSPPGARPTPTHTLQAIRHSARQERTVQLERTVLQLQGLGAPFYRVQPLEGGVRLTMPYVAATPHSELLGGGAVLLLTQAGAGSQLDLLTGGGQTQVSLLENPPRIVLDTVIYRDRSQTPPVAEALLPAGMRLRQLGALSLLSFDPSRFRPALVTAPWGERRPLAELVRGAGGAAGMNGGYFDVQSGRPVDLVVQGGLMRVGSLEKRASLGFTPAGELLLGYPAPRYVVGSSGAEVRVNQMTPSGHPERLTAWVGDGQPVGADGLTTLTLPLPRPSAGAGAVLAAQVGRVVSQPGRFYLTFDPARFPALPRTPGAPITVSLVWNTADAPWPSAQDVLSVGPLLLRGGQNVLNPAREGFDTSASIWRRTHQTAFGLLEGWPTFAYLESGTPEEFLAALQAAGLTEAIRVDSGGSSAVYVAGGYAGLGGYLNPAWSRDIPNALVMVPR